MARVEIASQAWGWLVDSLGNPLPSTSATLKNVDGTNATHWSAVTGGSSSTAALTSATDGTLSRYVEQGTYTLTVGATTRRVEATAGDAFRIRNVKDPVGALAGAVGDGSADDTAAIQAHKAALGAYGGALFFPAGKYNVDTTAGALIDVGAGDPVVLIGEGAGNVGNTSGSIFGTRIFRSAGTNPIYKVTGTSTTGDTRGHGGLVRIELHGGSLGGTLCKLERVNEIDLTQARIGNTTGSALHITQGWNSRFAGCFFTNSGTGTGTPAVLVDTVSLNESASNTLHFSDCEFEGNTGTDLKITGYAASTRPATTILLSNTKMEDVVASRTWPYLDIDYAQDVLASTLSIRSQGSGSTNTLIEIRDQGASTYAPLQFQNVSLVHTGTPTEYVNVRRSGPVSFDGLWCQGTPSNKYLKIDSGVSTSGIRLSGYHPQTAAKALDDQRTAVNLLYGRRRVPVDRTSNATSAELSSGVAVWDLADAATGVLSGNLEVPHDAMPARPFVFRVRWVSTTTSGTPEFFANFRAYASGADMTTAQSGAATAIPANPGVANQLAVTDMTTSLTANPGDVLTVKFFRNGSGGSDTLNGGTVRVVSLDLLYERQC